MDNKIKELAQAALAKWSAVAEDVDEAKFGVPLYSVLGEAIDVATLFDHHWKEQPFKANRKLPGFEGIAVTSLLTKETGAEIRELQLAITATQSEYLVLVQAADSAPMDRAEFVLQEIRSTLTYLFDDGVHDDADEQLANVERAFPTSGSQDAMALGLEGFADLADRYRDELSKIAGFDAGIIEEARSLAASLRKRSAELLTRSNGGEQSAVLSLRNRLLTLLFERVQRVRRGAQYLFRGHPEVLRKFSSNYERRQRSARRRRESDVVEAGEGAEVAAAKVG